MCLDDFEGKKQAHEIKASMLPTSDTVRVDDVSRVPRTFANSDDIKAATQQLTDRLGALSEVPESPNSLTMALHQIHKSLLQHIKVK